MKRLITISLAALTTASAFAALMLAPSSADARPHWRPRVGVYIGAPVIPYYYYPRPYYYPYYQPYYPPVVVQEQPVTYIEQSPPVAAAPAPQATPPAPGAQAQQPYWFYCQDTQTYFPHVQNCASPWQRVMPHAPQQTQ